MGGSNPLTKHFFFVFKQCLRWFSSAASSGLLWFYALAPNNSSIALASMQAAATSNSERFSPRRCRHKPRAVRWGSSPVSAAQPPGAAAAPQAAVVRRRVGGAPPPVRRRLSARRLLSQVRQLGHQFQLQCPVVALIHIRIPNMPK